MTELVELSGVNHKNLKVVKGCEIAFAKQQHMMVLQVAELAKAASCFPLFLSKNAATGDWNVGTITSFEMGNNLFVENDQWTAIYKPECLQTYPLFLMNSTGEKKGYTIGINEQSSAFSTEQGESLFEAENKASVFLTNTQSALEASITHNIQSVQFFVKLEQLQLIKSINLLVHYSDGKVDTLKGLNTIDEVKLKGLSSDDLMELNKLGYLTPIHAMLTSIYQLNSLIQKHNNIADKTKVSQVKIELGESARN